MRIDEPRLDLCKIAEGQGVTAHGPVTRMGDLIPALEEALAAVAAGKPYLLDVHVDTGYATPPLMRGTS